MLKDIAKLDAQNINVVKHKVSEDNELTLANKKRFARDGSYYQLEKMNSKYQICFNPPDNVPLPRYDIFSEGKPPGYLRCGSSAQARKTAEENEKNLLSFVPRSVQGAIYYQGEIARRQLQLDPARTELPPILTYRDHQEFLFHIKRGPGQEPSMGTTYEGGEYHVDIDPSGRHDRSAQVLELVTELLALNTSAKELPAPSVIPVITRQG